MGQINNQNLPNQLDAAWLIHARPYRETSYLAWFFCLEKGRVNALAKGWRNKKAHQKALLQPFTPLMLSFSGRSQLKYLSQLEATGAPKPLTGKALVCGLYANELLARLLPEGQPSQELFTNYSLLLELLNQPDQLEPALRSFEFSLLAYLDQPLVFSDEQGEPLVEDAWYNWQPTTGFSLLTSDATTSNQQALANSPQQPKFNGADLLAIQADKWHNLTTRNTAKLLTRLALYYHLGNKPLETRKLMQQFLRSGK